MAFDGETDPVPSAVAAMAAAMGATRGDARRFDRVFHRTLIPWCVGGFSRASLGRRGLHPAVFRGDRRARGASGELMSKRARPAAT
jgi:hypothetical protein